MPWVPAAPASACGLGSAGGNLLPSEVYQARKVASNLFRLLSCAGTYVAMFLIQGGRNKQKRCFWKRAVFVALSLQSRVFCSLEQNELLHHPVLFPEQNGGWQSSSSLVSFKDRSFQTLFCFISYCFAMHSILYYASGDFENSHSLTQFLYLPFLIPSPPYRTFFLFYLDEYSSFLDINETQGNKYSV